MMINVICTPHMYVYIYLYNCLLNNDASVYTICPEFHMHVYAILNSLPSNEKKWIGTYGQMFFFCYMW